MALKELEGRAARDIIIVPADKGGGICILSRTDYVAEGMRQLNDKSVYRLLPKDKSRQIGNDVINLCSKMKEAGVIDDKLAKSILPKDPKPGRLRLQPKIHKENHPSRPIISTNGTATEKLSAYVDYKLTPLMCKRVIPSYIRDSMDFLNHLQKIKTIGQESLLVSMDVVSLYTNIPHNDGLEAMEKYLNRFSEDKQEIPWIAKAANLVLTNNNFVFDEQHYLQIQGTAMGTKLAPKYANIFMASKPGIQFIRQNPFKTTVLLPLY
uniref:uncharacterized protein LOC120337836 n=1 Tax=Styela clava TaxID=7725 RepID=UPI00193A95E4|nr:uncharacterized protein LOC120337836 [Styela clava]